MISKYQWLISSGYQDVDLVESGDLDVKEDTLADVGFFVPGGSSSRMNDQEKKEMAHAIKQLFSKTNVTVAKGIVKSTEIVKKHGLWNSVVGAADWVYNHAGAATVSAITITGLYAFIRYAQQFNGPAFLRRELQRYGHALEIVNPGLNRFAHQNSDITVESMPRRFLSGVRHTLRHMTLGLSESVIDLGLWCIQQVSRLTSHEPTEPVPYVSEQTILNRQLNAALDSLERTLIERNMEIDEVGNLIDNVYPPRPGSQAYADLLRDFDPNSVL